MAIVVAYSSSLLPVSTLRAVARGGGWGCYGGYLLWVIFVEVTGYAELTGHGHIQTVTHNGV